MSEDRKFLSQSDQGKVIHITSQHTDIHYCSDLINAVQLFALNSGDDPAWIEILSPQGIQRYDLPPHSGLVPLYPADPAAPLSPDFFLDLDQKIEVISTSRGVSITGFVSFFS